jgi:nucleoid DNA-binding protein
MKADKSKTPKKINLVNDIPDIARSISHAYGIDRKIADEIVKDVLNSIQDTLLSNGIAGLKNFGTFKVRHDPGMKFYDFVTKSVQVVGRNVIVFHPSDGFKRMANTRKTTQGPAHPGQTNSDTD